MMQALLGAVLASGFAATFADIIANSAEAGKVSPEITQALQSSFASASHVAAKYPDLQDAILEAAKRSLLAGSLAAYLIGGIAILFGAIGVVFGLPSKAKELELRARYTKENA